MDSLFDVVVSEPVTLDTESDRSVFVSWVRGLSAREVVQQRLADFQLEASMSSTRMGKLPTMFGVQLSFRRRGSTAEETTQDEALSQRRQLHTLFSNDTADAYRVFDTIEHFLCQPEHLRGQLQVQLGDSTQSWMVERYHELDDAVVREIFGKRVASKTRKDLDDVSELTRVPLRSCHRQYDNIRRLLSNLEDSGVLQALSVTKEVRDKMGLSLALSAKYTATVFLLHLRFQVQSARRQTAHLTADDLCWSAIGMLNYWVGQGEYLKDFEETEAKHASTRRGEQFDDAKSEHVLREERQGAMEEGLLTSCGLDFEKRWIRLLCVIKMQLFTDYRGNTSLYDALRRHTMEYLQEAGMRANILDAISVQLRPTVKALASIGSGLSMSKEYRSIFEDLLEKVGNPLCDAGVDLKTMLPLLEALVQGFSKACITNAPYELRDADMVDAWRRYIYGVRIFFRYAYRGGRQPALSASRSRGN